MWKCLIDLMWRSVTVYIICGSLIGSDIQSSSDTLHLNFMSISAYFQLRCNSKTYYIIKRGTTTFFPFLVLLKKNGTIKCYFFLFEWYLYILKGHNRLRRLHRHLKDLENHLSYPSFRWLLPPRCHCRLVASCGYELQLWMPARSPCRELYGFDGKPAVAVRAEIKRDIAFRIATIK